jgi:predicted TIM-barrel fold metal-dependent hydrolase
VVQVIDFECTAPPSALTAWPHDLGPEGRQGSGLTWAGREPEPRPGYGMLNYERIFGTRRDSSPQHRRPPVTFDEFCEELEDAGVVKAFMSMPNPATVGAVHARPDLFMGLVRVSPFDGMRAVREFERIIREDGLHGLMTNPMDERIPASDRRFYPLYAKAAELGLPVRIYSTMNYATDRPFDLGHPRHLDQVCSDFPEMPVIAGLGGWPWVNEMVALLRRHPNLYMDTAAHHPKYFGVPGSGWEMLMQWGNTLIQDKILVGISPGSLGESYRDVIDAYLALPLKDAVMEKWLGGNAARLFNIDL